MLRKELCLVLLPLALAECASNGSAATVPAASDTPVLQSVQRLAAAWNAGDGQAWAAEYWPDGSLINILGVDFPDARGVAAVTAQILAGPFKDSTFGYTVPRIRRIGDAATVVDADVSVTNFRALPPGAVPTAPGLLSTRFTFVFENRNGVWKIAASQNTAVLPSPKS